MDRHDFYYGQHVTDLELDEGFTFAENADRAMMADEGVFGVSKGFGVAEHSPTPNLTVDVDGPGAAYDAEGQRISFAALQNCNVAADHNNASTAVVTPGNEKIVSVFLKFVRAESVPRTDDHGTTVYFLQPESWTFFVTQGSEGAHPATPPPLEADGILIADIHLIHGQTQVLDADIMCSSAIAGHALRTQWTIPLEITGRHAQKEIARQVRDAFAAVMGYFSSHSGGSAFKHETGDVTAPADTGHAHYDLLAGTLASQIAALLDNVNDACPWTGGTVTGDWLPHADAGVDTLGDVTHRWSLFFQDAFGAGDGMVQTGSVNPTEDNPFGTPHTLYKNNVPVAWGHVSGNALDATHYNVLSVTHVGTGHYTVTLDHAVDTKLCPVVVPVGTGQHVHVNVGVLALSEFDIYCVNSAGAALDLDCFFMVLGV